MKKSQPAATPKCRDPPRNKPTSLNPNITFLLGLPLQARTKPSFLLLSLPPKISSPFFNHPYKASSALHVVITNKEKLQVRPVSAAILQRRPFCCLF